MRAEWAGFASDCKHKAITFEKVDDTYAKIFYNGDRVGHIENYVKFFIVEVYFYRVTIGKNKKKYINKFVRDYSEWHQYVQYSCEIAKDRGLKILV